MDPATAFGRVLRQVRKDAGYTQERLALEAGVERNFVSLIERGINQPTVRVIFRLSKALSMAPSKLIHMVEQEIDRHIAK